MSKKNAWAQYGKRYRQQWEKLPNFKMWIQPVVMTQKDVQVLQV